MRIVYDVLWCTVSQATADQILQLREHLRVPVPGREYMRAYRTRKAGGKRAWDGKTDFYDMKSDRFPSGLLDMVRKFLDKQGIHHEVDLSRRAFLPVQPITADCLHGLTLEPLQLDAIKVTAGYGRGTGRYPTGFGKSIMYGALRLALGRPQMLVVVPSAQLGKQLPEDLERLLGEPVGRLTSKDYVLQPLTAATIKSLNLHWDKPDVRHFINYTDYLVIDEAQRAGADQYARVLQECPAQNRQAFSARPFPAGNTLRRRTVEAWIGPEFHRVTHRRAREAGMIPDVHVHTTMVHTPNTALQGRMASQPEAVRTFMEDPAMHQVLVTGLQDLQQRQVPTLISLNEYGELNTIFNVLERAGIPVTVCHGQMTPTAQQRVVKRFNDGEFLFLLKTRVLGEGADTKRAAVLVNLDVEIRGQSPADQLSGRLDRIRMAGGKRKPTAWLWELTCPQFYLLRALRDRLRVYKQKGYILHPFGEPWDIPEEVFVDVT